MFRSAHMMPMTASQLGQFIAKHATTTQRARPAPTTTIIGNRVPGMRAILAAQGYDAGVLAHGGIDTNNRYYLAPDSHLPHTGPITRGELAAQLAGAQCIYSNACTAPGVTPAFFAQYAPRAHTITMGSPDSVIHPLNMFLPNWALRGTYHGKPIRPTRTYRHTSSGWVDTGEYNNAFKRMGGLITAVPAAGLAAYALYRLLRGRQAKHTTQPADRSMPNKSPGVVSPGA